MHGVIRLRRSMCDEEFQHVVMIDAKSITWNNLWGARREINNQAGMSLRAGPRCTSYHTNSSHGVPDFSSSRACCASPQCPYEGGACAFAAPNVALSQP